MSFQDVLNGVQQAAGTVSGVMSATGRLLDALGLGAPSYQDQVRPASFRGIPFAVLAGEGSFGRRNAIHEYPNRDTVWVEDMGRAARKISLIGFLVGDDVIQQRDQLIAAAETEDMGELVHPTLGTMFVSLITLRVTEKWDSGRVFEIALSFVESGLKEFPSDTTDTASDVLGAVGDANLATAADFLHQVADAVKQGIAIVQQVVNTVTKWVGIVKNVINAARNLYNAVHSIPGTFGRFHGLLDSGSSSGAAPRNATATAVAVRLAIAQGTQARATVANNLSSMSSAAGALSSGSSTINAFSSSVQTVVSSMLSACASPLDGINALTQLAQFTPPVLAQDSSPIGQAMTTAQNATAALLRRSAVIGVCQASASYQPSSYEGAAAMRARVTTLLDVEIQSAADQGLDATYLALRRLRAAVVADLTARGGKLSRMTTVSTPAPVPALLLAQRLYRDPARADELVQQADPIHPAFMPVSFKALAQ
ncbi:DNA circularization N-terminal domain-containing protein [Chromobacterium sp. S0633]|uniref:DNA circularization protein n=1 Tax=Chromobacterium sp. S0633 TaxID=2957805 RepID=UPI00209E0D46|nr:DNA circularization N-terminal domain-containing protein [Chromobacterium sp. S0633]MCP1290937.1 DNA circularization N-terminal domain-containing protein [Chromobacterium sp. S0633]